MKRASSVISNSSRNKKPKTILDYFAPKQEKHIDIEYEKQPPVKSVQVIQYKKPILIHEECTKMETDNKIPTQLERGLGRNKNNETKTNRSS
jgi:hypothetical protein